MVWDRNRVRQTNNRLSHCTADMKTISINFMPGFHSYRAVNTIRLYCKHQAFNVVHKHNYCLFWDQYTSQKCSLCAEYRVFFYLKPGGSYNKGRTSQGWSLSQSLQNFIQMAKCTVYRGGVTGFLTKKNAMFSNKTHPVPHSKLNYWLQTS
jgi:hypothetical protein